MKRVFQYFLCFILIIVNLLYVWLCLTESGSFVKFFSDLWPLNWFIFGGILMVVFPLFNIILLKNVKQIVWFDYSLVFVPIMLWFWLVFGQWIIPLFWGSTGNFLVIAPAIICTTSCLYLLRFSKFVQSIIGPALWKVSLILWFLIFIIVSFLHAKCPVR